MAAETGVETQDWLFKRGGSLGGFTSWKRRYIVLKAGASLIIWYEWEQQAMRDAVNQTKEAKGNLSVSGATVSTCDDKVARACMSARRGARARSAAWTRVMAA